ncbi:MAG: GTPase ObgE [Phycisphaerae bacterium]|nr:GTPase ObgE [Phycisphaerae bacterium]
MFIDQAEIYIKAGKGGPGCVSFRREKYIPKGGPDGGDGGKGGDVVLIADESVTTLLDFTGRHHWIAENGRPGSGQNRSGRSGKDLEIRLPPGTLIYDRDSGRLLKDLDQPGMRVIIGHGGRGGQGNAKFATSRRQAPRYAQPGEESDERWLRLELKLIADVGLVGMPNAGKSTLLSRLSAARPKIADYPFTTLEPQLGIVEVTGYRRFVMADIPGLIEGAHQGHGLGDDFLRHIERTRVLVHLIDVHPLPGTTPPIDAYRMIRKELEAYSKELAAKPELIVANKIDLADNADAIDELKAELGGLPVRAISGVTGAGLQGLAECLWDMIQQAKEDEEREKASRPPAHDPFDDPFAEHRSEISDDIDNVVDDVADADEPELSEDEDAES